MATEPTRPCASCGTKLPVEATFCMACGKPQATSEAEPAAASTPFALAEDDEVPAPRAPPPEPAPPEPGKTVELADEASDDPEPEPDEDEEPGGTTVRMPLSDVVAAWAEDAPTSATPDVEAPRVPLTSNPKFVIAVLLAAAVAIGAAVVLLT